MPVEPVVRLQVHNQWTRALAVGSQLASVLDLELRYPTEAARQNNYALSVDPAHGWDGWIRFWYTRPQDSCHVFPTGLLSCVVAVLDRFGYAYAVEDQRLRTPPAPEPYAKPVALRDYQKEAVAAVLRAGRGVVASPPRSGKTLLMGEVVNQLGLPTLWTAPTDRICKQTLEALRRILGQTRVVHLVGQAESEVAKASPVVVCTIATAVGLGPEWLRSRKVLVVDEWHHAAAQSYHKLFRDADHIFWRLGMTGTHYRSGDDGMAMHALLSNTIYSISAAELCERGHLVPTDVVFLPSTAPQLTGMGTHWPDVVRYGIWDNVPRNQAAAQVAAYLATAGRKVLLLVNCKSQGRMLRDLILALLPTKHPLAEFSPVEFCSTDMRRHKIGRVVDSFNTLEEIKVLIGTSLLGEGVDLPAADALVYARGEKAEVSLVQNAFRVCTAAPGKSRALIVDFADSHHRSLRRQAHERLATYHGQATFRVRTSPGLLDFVGWTREAGHVQPAPEERPSVGSWVQTPLFQPKPAPTQG